MFSGHSLRTTFDLDVLTSFVAAVELKSLAAAGTRLGRSTSAMSAQMKRLEDTAGIAVFRKRGRGLELTEPGAALLSYARRLLDLNDETVIAMQQIGAGGSCKLALQQDFCEGMLPRVLGQFIRAHPSIRLDVQVASNAALRALSTSRSADLIIAWDIGNFDRKPRWKRKLPICWIGSSELDGRQVAERPLALVTLGQDCYFRSVATKALDTAQRPWRIAMSTPSLSGVWAGVEAALGVTTRTSIGMPAHLTAISPDNPEFVLPPLPTIAISAFLPKGKQPIAESLAELFCDQVEKSSIC